MTIERESRRSDVYLGDGSSTSLPFGFKVFLPTEIAVVLNENGTERTLSHGQGCSVVLNVEQDVQPGGTVRLNEPLPAGSKAVVLSNVRPLQQVDLTNQGGFYPDVLNAVHDRAIMLIQQLMEAQSRTPQVPATDTAGAEELSRQILELSRSLPSIQALLSSDELKKLLELIRNNPNLGVELSSAVDSAREDVAATSKAVKTAYDKAKSAADSAAAAEQAANGADGKIALLAKRVLPVGKIELLPFSPTALKDGWYHANGDKYSTSSPQGKALLSLSEEYRTAFKITARDEQINLPNLYHSDGRGFFFRASKTVGAIQEDAIRNLTGTAQFNGQEAAQVQSSGVFNTETAGHRRPNLFANDYDRDVARLSFDASRVVPTAEENRPLNIGMTPAIYLGV